MFAILSYLAKPIRRSELTTQLDRNGATTHRDGIEFHRDRVKFDEKRNRSGPLMSTAARVTFPRRIDVARFCSRFATTEPASRLRNAKHFSKPFVTGKPTATDFGLVRLPDGGCRELRWHDRFRDNQPAAPAFENPAFD